MPKENVQLLINTYGTFGLAGIAVAAYTVGIYFEWLLLALILGIGVLIFQFKYSTSATNRFLISIILPLQLFLAFSNPDLTEPFKSSSKGYFLPSEIIQKIEIIAPISASVCLSTLVIGLWSISWSKNQSTSSNS